MFQPLLPFPDWDQIKVNRELPPELLANLVSGTPIPIDLQRWNEGYSAQRVLRILTSLFTEDATTSLWLNDYTNPAFKANLGGYLTLFGDKLENLRDYDAPSFEFVDPTDSYFGAFPPPCTFVHGRFNGVPHPGYLHSLVYARENYPNLPVTLAIETDDYTIREGQHPFLDVLFRASLLYFTGLIDRLIIIKAPFHGDDVYGESEGGVNLYWDYMYGVDTGIINPMLLISFGEQDLGRKEARAPMRLNIMHMDGLNVQSNEIHMSDIRANTVNQQMLVEEWAKLVGKVN